MIFVAKQRVQAGAGTEVAVHVGIVGEPAVRQATGRDGGLGIHYSRVGVLVDVRPPGLGVADEPGLRKPLERLLKTLEPEIVGSVLKMQDHRHVVIMPDLRHQGDVFGVGLDGELLLSDSDRAHLQILLQHGARLGNIGKLIGEEDEVFGILARQFHAGIVPAGAYG